MAPLTVTEDQNTTNKTKNNKQQTNKATQQTTTFTMISGAPDHWLQKMCSSAAMIVFAQELTLLKNKCIDQEFQTPNRHIY